MGILAAPSDTATAADIDAQLDVAFRMFDLQVSIHHIAQLFFFFFFSSASSASFSAGVSGESCAGM